MAVTRCPKCHVPLTPEEAQGPTCPACKSAFALVGHPTTEGTVNQAAVAPSQGSDAGLGFVLALVGAITGGVIGVLAFGGKLQAIRKQIDELRRQEQALAKELAQIEAATPSTVQKELKKLQGIWKGVASESDGQRPAKGWFLERFTKAKLTVKEGKLSFSSDGNRPWEIAYQSHRKSKLDTYWLDPAKKPTTFTITLSMGGFLSGSIETVYGIYKLQGNQLTVCYATLLT